MNPADAKLCAEHNAANGCLHDCTAEHFHLSGPNSPYTEVRDYLIYVCDCPEKQGTGKCDRAARNEKMGCWTPTLINLAMNFGNLK